MKLKKMVSLIVTLGLLSSVALTGCSKQAEAAPAPEATPAPTETSKVFVVGTSGEYFPWCFKKDDQLQGFEVEVWNEIAKRAGYQIEFKVSKFSGLFGMLDAGQIDTVAHQISTTEERRAKYDFTDTYAYSSYSMVIKDDSAMKTLDDLKGKKVGCVLGGNGEKTLKALNEENNLGLEIVTYDGTPMEKDVEIGRLDAAWYGTVKARTTIEKESLKLKLIEGNRVYETNQYPFVRNEMNKEKIAAANKAIKEMLEDGTMSSLSMKWFNLDVTKK